MTRPTPLGCLQLGDDILGSSWLTQCAVGADSCRRFSATGVASYGLDEPTISVCSMV